MTKDLIEEIIKEVEEAGGKVKAMVSDMAQGCSLWSTIYIHLTSSIPLAKRYHCNFVLIKLIDHQLFNRTTKTCGPPWGVLPPSPGSSTLRTTHARSLRWRILHTWSSCWGRNKVIPAPPLMHRGLTVAAFLPTEIIFLIRNGNQCCHNKIII